MTCQQIAQFLLDYLSGELPAELRATFESHVSGCGPCQRYLDSYRKTVAMSKAAMADRAVAVRVEEMPEPLVCAILGACRASSARS